MHFCFIDQLLAINKHNVFVDLCIFSHHLRCRFIMKGSNANVQYKQEERFQCSFGHLTIVLRQT